MLVADQTFAAQGARIEVDTEIKEGPGSKFRTIAKLEKNQLVVASNLSLEGFYKIRTRKGVIGWISADHLSTIKPVLKSYESDITEKPSAEEPPSEVPDNSNSSSEPLSPLD